MNIQNIIHICYFSPSYPGNFIASLSKLAEVSQKKYSLFFLFPTQAKNAEWLSMLPVTSDHIFFCDFSPKALYSCCKRLSNMLGRNATIAHTHFIDYLHLLAIKRCFKNNVCHYHMAAPESNTWKRKIRKVICNIIYKNSVIIGVSEPVTEKLRVYFRNIDCECITNAIDFERLSTYTGQEVYLSKRDADEFYLLIHGSDFIRKGVDLAIQAVDNINKKHGIKCSLIITAHPTQTAEMFVRNYTDNSSNIKVVDVIKNIKDLYDEVDAFVSPSRSEAFAYAVAESSFCDCQVIASNVPGQNTMKDIPGIIWVEPNSVQNIEEAILLAIDRRKSNKLSNIKESQKLYVQENYGIDLWVKKNIDVYSKYF